MGQRAYCDRDHPVADADADWWCEMYHRPLQPKIARYTPAMTQTQNPGIEVLIHLNVTFPVDSHAEAEKLAWDYVRVHGIAESDVALLEAQ